MAGEFHASPYFGHVYPNETDMIWGTLIVVYPYLTGLVAGAFIVSSFYHVFGMERFRPVARFALLAALSFMLFTPTPLLFHLGHPERAMNAVWTPHLTSAMAAFGYVAGFYMFILVLEIWFAFRLDIIARSKATKGPLRVLYLALTLGSDDTSEKALLYDHKWGRGLAIIGIPSAMLLHGYVGFVFGSLKSREWWSSELMPIIFLLSAMVSGIAMLIVLYVLVSAVRRQPVDEDCLGGMIRAMWAFLMLAVAMEMLEFVNIVYKDKEGIETIWRLVEGPLAFTLLVLQLGLGSLVPFVVLTTMIFLGTRGKALVTGAVVSALLILIAVLSMRYNVVVGGQILSKSMKGLVYPEIPWFGRESILSAALLFASPFVVLWILTRLLPPWEPDSPVRLRGKRQAALGGETHAVPRPVE
jgi:Ni/Fe-hydrogenase subunit HybB-like protein